MRRNLVVMCALIFLFVGTQVCRSEELTPAKKADIERLLKLTGALKMADMVGNQFVQKMISGIQSARPEVPAQVFDIVKDEVGKCLSEAVSENGGFADLIAEIYHRHYSHEEIRGLISFYETPLGKKVIQVAPALMQEGMSVGMAWGQRLGPTIEERVKNRLRKEDIGI